MVLFIEWINRKNGGGVGGANLVDKLMNYMPKR